ncbi:hypothetical protein SAMN05444145_1054 [Alistipes timonensis JC136]|uniref:DUF5689 domain-containing protein n=1 Tax=Alistipes timonensis JC136 TaxID=1033731 RepID=A0A1H4CTG4_9BACT|nr:DUF5689 domain-containing protein [Alistipes timonensis]SEA63609.1 hypothetical protein SAMN05444145_1054 [Alistipes timonensis JC136]
MKNRLSNSFFRTAAAFALLLSAGSCKDDVALPMQSIALDTHAILAPSFGTTLSFEVRANCDWQISVTGDDTSWAQLSRSEATGTATVAVAIGENATSASRSLTLRVAAKRNAAVAEELNFVQASATSEGYLSVPDLRTLAADGDYTVTQEVKLRGIVVSSVQDNNYFENCLALQSDLKPRCGITLRTDETLYRNPGEELEIDLKGAVVGVNAETGVMELKPVSDDRVVRSETTQVTPEALPVTYAQLASGDYESMYVSLDAQVVVSDLNKVLSDNVTVQTADDERFTLYARQNSTFGIDAVPVGSGRLCGIAGVYDGNSVVMPCTAADFAAMNAPRFDGGITLPYVLSIMTRTATNGDGKYVYYSGSNSTGSIDGVSVTAMDGTGANITAKLSSSGGNLGFRYWTESSGHHNLPMKSWQELDQNYALLTFPLNETIDGPFRFSFGWSASGSAPANWYLRYSNDNVTWYTPAPTDGPHFVIPQGKTVGGGKNFFYWTIDIAPQIPLERRGTLYIRISPYDGTRVDRSGAAIGNGGEIRLHSCAVVEKVPVFNTEKPAGAVYFEPFDNLTTGLDYRHGDKLAAMLNFCGSDISVWDAAVKNGLSGTHVRQRPGYAQIGFVETQTVAHGSYTNNTGALMTPAFGASGTLTLSFDAMAYKNASVFSSSGAKDLKGDLKSVVVEVIGGGTIDGAAKKVVSGLTYTEFNRFSLTIDGATASTAVRFTSEPASGEFSRWFIDNICVTK